MGRIRQLPPDTVARIAAGEVIERPAAVLKELLENSIDAGATRVDVEVGQGRLDLIAVIDDGCGMDADDLPLALRAHATSKLVSADDLFHVGTLGFRGEGLASVGGVAKVSIQSRPGGAAAGAEVRCDGGAVGEVRVWNGAAGTRVEVRHLFFNAPVRRKFLRGASTEMGHVAETFTRLALARLGLHLTLKHNGRSVYDVPAAAGLLDRIATFFGDDLRKRLLPVEGEQGGTTLGGYVATPEREGPGTGMQYLFVNGRWVRDRLVSQALQEAYRGLLMTGRHPVAFLYLDVPPEEVDVNVHPTKAEVRFRDPSRVQALVQQAVRRRLQGEDLTPAVRVPAAPAPAPRPVAQPELAFSAPRRAEPRPTVAPSRPAAPAPAPVALKPKSAPPARPIKAVQMHDLYIVAEVEDGVLIFDQHALHERILFEQLKTRFAAGKAEVQKLLIPETVAFPPARAALLLEHADALASLGLEVADFGGGSVLLSGYPAALGKQPPRDVLRAVADYLGRQERPPTREAMLNDVMALMACHAAVRAGDRLSPDEVQALLARRDLAESSHHCPHGRPSSLMFTRAELDRQFRRTS